MTKTCGLESPPPPTCCTQYPPGCVVLECRLDGNYPVAHAVHIPSDSSPSPAMCLLLETRQSEKGPLARVAAKLEKNVTTTPLTQVSYHLESRNGPEGAVAIAGRSPLHSDGSSAMNGPPVTLLETTKLEGPIARVLYNPTSKPSKIPQQVLTHVKCTTSPEGSFANLTQTALDKEAANHLKEPQRNTCFQTFMKHDGNCPTATAIKTNLPYKNVLPSDERLFPDSETLETRIVEGKVKAKGLINSNGSCLYLESRSRDEVSEAGIDQSLKICKLNEVRNSLQRPDHRNKLPSSLMIKEEAESCGSKMGPFISARSRSCILQKSLEKNTISPVPAALSRKNGLDPTPSEILGKEGKFKFLKPIKKIQTSRVYPDRCHYFGELEASHLTKRDFRNSGIKVTSSEENGFGNVEAPKCEKKVKKEIKEKYLKEAAYEEVPLPSPQELIKCYREYLSDAQIKKYQYCASKRNGLQDECYLSVPRAVVQIKMEEMKMKKEGRMENSVSEGDDSSQCKENLKKDK